jgi:hypothetical protein
MSTTYAERVAARAKAEHERQRLAAKREAEWKAAKAEADKAAAEAEAKAAAAEIEAEAVARTGYIERASAALLPLCRELHDEIKNAKVVELVRVTNELHRQAKVELGPEHADCVFAVLARQVCHAHFEQRPNVANKIANPATWEWSGAPRFTEFRGALQRAINSGDVAAARAAFEGLDACVWSMHRDDAQPDPAAIETWRAMQDPDRRVYASHQARVAEAERVRRRGEDSGRNASSVRHAMAGVVRKVLGRSGEPSEVVVVDDINETLRQLEKIESSASTV